jgi:hypothetical protein
MVGLSGKKYLPNGSTNTNALYSGTPWENIFAHYDGKTWTAVQTPIIYNENAGVNSLFMDSSGDGWAVGFVAAANASNSSPSNLYLHYTGGKWTQVNGPGSDGLYSVFLTSASEGWAVGSNGTIMHYQNGTWSMAAGVPSPTPTPETVNGTPVVQPCYSQATPPPGPPLSGTPAPIPASGWSTYTNTKYHYTINYPTGWPVDNLQCPDADSLIFWNYYYQQWNGPGFPPGGIKIELGALDNASQMSALQFLQTEEQNDQQSVAGPPCPSFTTQTLKVGGHDAAEGSCTAASGFVVVFVSDGNTMLRISDDFAANGQPSDVFNQMLASMAFTS